MGRMIGIDLGTTSCRAAVMECGVPRVISNQEGERATPTLVAFTADGEPLVGRAAERVAVSDPQSAVAGVTRFIGRRLDARTARSAQASLPFGLTTAPNGDLRLKLADRVYAPEEIASLLLRKLKTAAEGQLGEPVQQAVLTVPASFNDLQRRAMRQAGRIAGLEIARVISASTAAALGYVLDGRGRSTGSLVVYGLGGGTLDVTVLELAEGLVQVVATGGDAALGGDDFDQRIVDWLVGELQREQGVGLRKDGRALPALKRAVERAKRALTTSSETEVALALASAAGDGRRELRVRLTRQKYEELTEELLARAIVPCQQGLADARLRPDLVDAVLLVGGQTRAPRVADQVRKLFGKQPVRPQDPEAAVALGAAVQAGIIQGEVDGLVLLDVTPHTLGIETKDGTFTPLIERNRPIPARRSRVFTTMADNQTRVEVHVLQGESDMAAYNKSLHRFELTSIPPAPRGVPQIEVGFEIDVNGIVSVQAIDQATGRRQALTLRPSGGLSPTDVERLLHDARPQSRRSVPMNQSS